jgi:hypothetical protein
MSLSMVSAGARTLEQFAADSVAAMPGFDIKPATTNVAGTEAIVLDNVPGQDLLRHVLFAHNGRLYDLTFSPADHEQMEAFYTAILADLTLIESAQ